MRIGEYRVVIQSMEGELLAEVERTAATGHPAVGEEIVLDGHIYVVERVRHEDDADGRSRRRYTWPRLFVRRRDGIVRGRRKEAIRAPPRVLPFPQRRRPRGVQSVILPAPLVAVLVASGYDQQARYFARRARGAARLSRIGQGWFVEAGESPAEAMLQAREARRGRRRMEDWLAALATPETVARLRAERSLIEWQRERERAERALAERQRLERGPDLSLLSDGAAWSWRALWRARASPAGSSARPG
jgi:hypothetical protein